MTAWFVDLAYWFGMDQLPVVLFPYGDVFRTIVWPALGLFLPFIVIAGLALWAVAQVFGTSRR
jgi:hypothetical protein